MSKTDFVHCKGRIDGTIGSVQRQWTCLDHGEGTAIPVAAVPVLLRIAERDPFNRIIQ